MQAYLKELEAVEGLARAAQARISLMAATVAEDEAHDAFATVSFDRGTAHRVLDAVQGGRSLSARLASLSYSYGRALTQGVPMGIPLGMSEAPDRLDVLRDAFLEFVDGLNSYSVPGASAVENGLLSSAKALSGDSNRLKLLRDVYDLSRPIETLTGARGKDEPLDAPDPFEWDSGLLSQKAIADVGVALSRHIARDVNARTKALLQGGADLDTAAVQKSVNDGASNLAGRVDYYVQRASRNATYNAATSDKMVKQVARLAGPNACYFCAMLASRGYVYTNDSFGDWQVHPNCHCTQVFRWEKSPVSDVERWIDLWRQLNPSGLADWRDKLAAHRASQ